MNRVHALSTEELTAVEELYRQTKDADVRSRCQMILLSNEGLSPPKIAEQVRFHRRTVTCYIQRYEAEGIYGLLTRPRSGRPPQVTEAYTALLLKAVAQVPRTLGLPFSNWTTANLAEYLAAKIGIELSPRQVENILKANDWRLRRPVRTVKHKQDPDLVEEKKRIRQVMSQADDNLIILFADSAVVSLMPTITRCWTKIGRQRLILTPGVRAQKRWNWGAVDVVTGRTVQIMHKQRNNIGFRRLLAAISRTFELGEQPQRKVLLFVDNDRAHDAKAVRKLLGKHKERIQIEWLPTYSPELNPQEDIWQHMRRRVTHNHYFEELDALLEAVQEFHCGLDDDQKQVLRLISKWIRFIST